MSEVQPESLCPTHSGTHLASTTAGCAGAIAVPEPLSFGGRRALLKKKPGKRTAKTVSKAATAAAARKAAAQRAALAAKKAAAAKMAAQVN
jgi:hypothetical protein